MSSYYDDSIKSIQESLARIMEPMRKTLSLYSEMLAPVESYQAALEKAMKPYYTLLNQQHIFSSPVSAAVEKMSKEIASTINAYPNTALLIDSITKAYENIPKPIFPSSFIAALEHLGEYSFPDDLGGLDDLEAPDSDYVTVDESAVKEIDISETITFSVGNCRVKIKTGEFIALILQVVGIIIAIITLTSPSDSAASVETQNQLEQVQIQLLQSQNQILYDLLHTMDTSASNEAEALEALRDSVESQNSEISDLKESLDSIEQSIDNMNKDDCTEPETQSL